MHPRGTTKAPASPHTTRTGGVRAGRAPGQSEGERGRQEYVEKTKVVTYANKFYIFVIPGKLLIKPRINK